MLNRVAILMAAASAACVQTPVETLPSPLPAPASYQEAVAMVARRQAADDSVVVAGGRSLLLTHGERTARVFVLLHGFSDLPEQFAVVGDHLYSGGDNVYIPRLPRHGERRSPIRSLGRIRAEELARFGDSTVAIARGLGDSIIVVGLSAGGVIAGNIAQSHTEVDRAVLIAPAIAPGTLSDDQGHGLVILASKLPEITRTNAPIDTTRPDYVQGITTHGLAQVLLLGQQLRDASADRAPGTKEMIFLLNEADHTVSEQAAVDVARRWFDHGAHVGVYRFAASLKLQHNVMEIDAHGGNVGLVFPVVEALARGVTPPTVAELQDAPCAGWRCAIKRLLNK
ncbi:MAG TPA: alpha/beta fold hydrolase [Gemmatimonadaceae bacterium]